MLPRLIQKTYNSDDDDASNTTFRYVRKHSNEMYAAKMYERHSPSCSDDDDKIELIEKEIPNNRSWFPRDDYNDEDDDLVNVTISIQKIYAIKR